MKRLIFVVCLVVLIVPHGLAVELRSYTLGDVDGFINDGVDDDVYADPAWADWAKTYHEDNFNGLVRAPFDGTREDGVALQNRWIPFTFMFALAENEEIFAAKLSFGLRGRGVETDFIVLGTPDHILMFEDLGWVPISETETEIRELGIPYALLPLLEQGQFNLSIADDTGVDYATLTLVLIPEPCTLLLFGMGVVILRRRWRQ